MAKSKISYVKILHLSLKVWFCEFVVYLFWGSIGCCGTDILCDAGHAGIGLGPWMRLWVTHAYILLRGQGKECLLLKHLVRHFWPVTKKKKNKCAFFLWSIFFLFVHHLCVLSSASDTPLVYLSEFPLATCKLIFCTTYWFLLRPSFACCTALIYEALGNWLYLSDSK